MPVIPTFTSQVAYQDAPPDARVSPQAAAAPQQAIADTMDRVSSHFAEALAYHEQAQARADAVTLGVNLSMDLRDKTNQFKTDPDQATAPQRFRDDAKAWATQSLAAIPDPMVRAHVAEHLTRQIGSAYGEVAATSLNTVRKAQGDALIETANRGALLMGGATDNLGIANAVAGIQEAGKAAVAAGHMNQAQADDMVGRNIALGLHLQARDDPATGRKANPLGAMQLLGTYKDQLTAEQYLSTENFLRTPVNHALGEGAAAATNAWSGTITTDVRARARAYHDELTQAGFDDDTAWALTARSVLESGARVNPGNGDGGASHGSMQWNNFGPGGGPGRLDNYRARYGHDPGQGTIAEHADFIKWELNGPEAAAKTAIDQAQGAEDKARAVSRFYIRPGKTEEAKTAEAERTAAVVRQLMGGPGGPDLKARIEDVRTRTADMPIEAQQHAESLVHREYTLDNSGHAADVADVHHYIADTSARLLAGITTPWSPERIYAVLPYKDAKQAVDTLTLHETAGQALAGLRWATPTDIADMRRDFETGQGRYSDAVRARHGQVTGPGTATDPNAADSGDLITKRRQVADLIEGAIRKREDALRADSAGYVAAHPTVQALAANLPTGGPAAMEAYARASKAVQGQLGVPESQQRVLTGDQVAKTVEQLNGVDPAKADMGVALSNVATSYGGAWPQAFGELVKYGKLSRDYQILAMMAPEPGKPDTQAAARQDYQRALALRAQKGGMAELASATPDAAKKDIDTKIDDTIGPFRASARWNQGGAELISTVKDAVKTQAYYLAIQGYSASDALQRAFQGIIEDKYDLPHNWFGDKPSAGDALRAPKGKMGEVQSAASRLQAGLKPEDIAIPAEPKAIAESDRRDAMLTAARRGWWVPNADDTGLTLVGKLRDGQILPMKRPDGSLIGFRFDNLPAASALEPPALLGVPQ